MLPCMTEHGGGKPTTRCMCVMSAENSESSKTVFKNVPRESLQGSPLINQLFTLSKRGSAWKTKVNSVWNPYFESQKNMWKGGKGNKLDFVSLSPLTFLFSGYFWIASLTPSPFKRLRKCIATLLQTYRKDVSCCRLEIWLVYVNISSSHSWIYHHPFICSV